jgi:hypothetical protein
MSQANDPQHPEDQHRQTLLTTLVTMAHEADGFADAASRGEASVTGRSRWSRLALTCGIFGALAAAAAVALVVLPTLGPASPSASDARLATADQPRPPTGVVLIPRASEIRPVSTHAPAGTARDIPMPASGDATVLLAVFSDETSDGNSNCGCTIFTPVAWSDDRSLGEIGRGELISAALARRCGGGGELRFVLAMQGPVESLPANAAAARSLASCMSSGPDACSDEGSCFASAALRCVPDGVNVLAETMQVAAK